MKTKTATVIVSHVFGTAGEFAGEVWYRNRRLFFKWGTVPADLAQDCRRFALGAGFTHCKYCLE